MVKTCDWILGDILLFVLSRYVICLMKWSHTIFIFMLFWKKHLVCSTCPSDLKLQFHCQIFKSVEILFTLDNFFFCECSLRRKKSRLQKQLMAQNVGLVSMFPTVFLTIKCLKSWYLLLLHFKMWKGTPNQRNLF